MSFFSTDHLDSSPGSRGPRTGFFENISIGYNQQYEVDSQLSIVDAFREEHNRNVEELERITGQKQRRITLQEAALFLQIRGGDAAPAVTAAPSFSQPFVQSRQAYLAEREAAAQDARDAAINNDALFVSNGLRANEEILQEIFALQRKVEGESAQAAETRGWAGFTGNVLGAIGGSFSARDPLLLASLPIGGGGRTVAMRLATEAAAAGTVEGVLQFGAIAENREMAGLPAYSTEQRLASVLTVAGGAAALRGVLFELPAFGARRFAEAAAPDIRLDFEDAQLRQFLGNMPDSPRVRAASDMLDEDALVTRLSPYGDGYEGLRRFTEETAEVEMALLGRSDTAIGRALPPDLPLPMREREADFKIVREQAPKVAARFDAAQARVAELDNRITAVTDEIASRTVIDAVRLVDEDAARQLEALAAAEELRPDQWAFNRIKADQILNRVGKERILRAAEDAEIAPRKETQRLRQQRKAANKEYKAALKAMEAERVSLTAAADRVKAMMSGEVKDLLGYAIQTRPMRGSALSREVVKQQRELILRDADRVVEDVALPAPRDDGMIELGDTLIPQNFRFFDDDLGDTATASSVLRDLDEDERMIQAMRTCSL